MRQLALVITLLILGTGLIGCTTSKTTVSNSLPYEVQQRVNTSEEFDVSFDFEPHPEGDKVEAAFGSGTSTYSVNTPLRGQFQELVETKFGSITDGSDNSIRVAVTDLQPSTDSQTHTLNMTVEVTTVQEGEENARDFSYSTTIRPIDTSTEYTMGKRIPKEDLQEFFLKFVVGADKFIDSNFGVQN
jgi:hypothetical protein